MVRRSIGCCVLLAAFTSIATAFEIQFLALPSPEMPEHLAKTGEGRPRNIKFRAVLDKQVCSPHHPIVLGGIDITQGSLEDAHIAIDVLTARGAQVAAKTSPLTSTQMSFDLPAGSLPPGEYLVRLTATNGDSDRPATTLPLRVTRAPAVATIGEIRLQQIQPATQSVDRWHARAGVPFPEGALWSADHVQLVDAHGREIFAHPHTLATWSKAGSIKWLALDFQLPLTADKAQSLTLRFGPNVKRQTQPGLQVEQTDQTIHVDTGVARFVVRKQGFNFIDEMWVGNSQLITSGKGRGPYMIDEHGKTHWAHLDADSNVVVEHQNPLKTVIRAEGWHKDAAGLTLGRYVMRLYFYADQNYFRAQHTFIIAEDTDKVRYRDIALAVPVSGSDYRFGVKDGHVVGDDSIHLLQKRWDQYVIRRDTTIESEGDRAPGILGRGSVAIIVRDFWQNFPKELEATPDNLIVHFWPRHGERVWSEQDEIQPEHAYLLPFVHQGETLDFKMPQSYFNGPLSQTYGFARPDGKGGWRPYYGEGAAKSNAMGLGKTHDMLIAFGDTASPEQSAALRDLFQKDIHFLPDPTWTCAANVVGDMTPHDPERFPRQEASFSDGFDFLMRWTFDMTHAYGMFNYGDSYHVPQLLSSNLNPGYYRLWAGYHHGRARVPWLLYLRSGDPKYFTWARANTQHLIDVDTCHFATAEATRWPRRSRKLVGGLCDYKGIVHWHTGARVDDYNNMLDFMQLDYYLTGNRRVLDVMRNTGELLIERASGHTERHAVTLGALLDYYKYTYDARALLRLTQQLPHCYTKPAIEHSPQSIGWGPYIEPWIEYSADPKATAFLMQFVNALADPAQSPGGVHFYGDGRALAKAYQLTGAVQYLRHGWAYYNRGPDAFRMPGHKFHQIADWLNWSYETQQCLPLLAHINTLERNPTPAETPYRAAGPYLHTQPNGKPNELVFSIFEKKDQQFHFAGEKVWTRKDLEYELINPNGTRVQSGFIPQGEYPFQHTQNRDGVTGTYTLKIFGPDEYNLRNNRITTLGMERFHLPTQRNYLTGRWYIYVPKSCKNITIGLEAYPKPETTSRLELIGPNETIVDSAHLTWENKTATIDIAVDPEHRGRVWTVAASRVTIKRWEGPPRWVATSYDAALPQSDEQP